MIGGPAKDDPPRGDPARGDPAPYPRMFPGGGRIGAEEEEAVLRVLRDKRLFRYDGLGDGPSAVEAFERDFAGLLASEHAVAVGSGTLALMAALAAAGVGPGDEVIVPAYTWVSTAVAVLAVGAVPVVAEVDDTLTLDVEDAARRISVRTRALIPVHMRGAAADMDAVVGVAGRYGLRVIEDAAQAIGGRFRGRRLGTLGELGCFSLQYNKIITCGEGGVVVTDDDVLYERVLMYHDVAAGQRRSLGSSEPFYGLVCRLSELQGAVAGAQLTRLDDIIGDCRRNRARLIEAISDVAAERGVRLRESHDQDGDTGIALVLLCPTAPAARSLAAALEAERVPVRVLFDEEREDLHVACHWKPILERRSWSRRTPWSEAGREIVYGPECWTRTVDLLGRAVHVDVSPDLTEPQLDRLAGSLRHAVMKQ